MTEPSVRDHAVVFVAPSGGPTRNGEPVFAEPWEGRAFALAVETVDRLGLQWTVFRERLVAAIADEPNRPYYESWLVTLERLVLDHHVAEPGDLAAHRMQAASYRVDEHAAGDVEIFPVAITESRLRDALDRLVNHGLLDAGDSPLGQYTYAELARVWVDGAPVSWMFRLYNVAGEQELTVCLPNPFLDDEQRPSPEPDWGRLECWDELRRSLLDLDSDPRDRSGTRFVRP
ncbi:MAG: hypothetical protein QOD72_554 [Acidimicrobiaceae bacterium]|jgi:hypothetical protein|nr:hypothetical protein [Acidimicrobiaceae bacterium]